MNKVKTKILSIFLVLLMSNELLADSSLNFSQLEGCYQTLLIDGHPIHAGPDRSRSLTRIESHTSSLYFDKDKNPLQVLMVVFYLGYENNFYRYHSFILFPEVGDTTSSNDELYYSFRGEIMMRNWQVYQTVDHNIFFHGLKKEDHLLVGEVTFFSKIREMSGERQFKLKKVPCS